MHLLTFAQFFFMLFANVQRSNTRKNGIWFCSNASPFFSSCQRAINGVSCITIYKFVQPAMNKLILNVLNASLIISLCQLPMNGLMLSKSVKIYNYSSVMSANYPGLLETVLLFIGLYQLGVNGLKLNMSVKTVSLLISHVSYQ